MAEVVAARGQAARQLPTDLSDRYEVLRARLWGDRRGPPRRQPLRGLPPRAPLDRGRPDPPPAARHRRDLRPVRAHPGAARGPVLRAERRRRAGPDPSRRGHRQRRRAPARAFRRRADRQRPASGAALGPPPRPGDRPGHEPAAAGRPTRRAPWASAVAATVDDRWVEVDYGEFEGRALGDVPAEVWRRWRSDPTFRPERGETLAEVGARVAGRLRRAVQRGGLGGPGRRRRRGGGQPRVARSRRPSPGRSGATRRWPGGCTCPPGRSPGSPGGRPAPLLETFNEVPPVVAAVVRPRRRPVARRRRRAMIGPMTDHRQRARRPRRATTATPVHRRTMDFEVFEAPRATFGRGRPAARRAALGGRDRPGRARPRHRAAGDRAPARPDHHRGGGRRCAVPPRRVPADRGGVRRPGRAERGPGLHPGRPGALRPAARLHPSRVPGPGHRPGRGPGHPVVGRPPAEARAGRGEDGRRPAPAGWPTPATSGPPAGPGSRSWPSAGARARASTRRRRWSSCAAAHPAGLSAGRPGARPRRGGVRPGCRR